MEKELIKFYQNLKQDIRATQLSEEDGGNSEQIFTQIAVNSLADAGETENVSLAFDKKAIGTRNQHQINAYSVSDNYETVDLIITVFKGTDEIETTTKSEIETAQKRISNFFNKCISKEYVNEIEESSEIFQLANTLANYQELKENLVRVNAIILTDGEYKGEFPKNEKINDYNVFYRVIDIRFLYKISEEARVPIEIDFNDFDGEKFEIPCLPASTENPDYKAYIAIIPGTCLAKLYERYGARLLEQNVRSFLQFTGKINKGIRDTIRNEPHMFFAFNNGIAATADHIELDESGYFVKKINNLQIVNGGQTTASIYNTAKKDRADISNIFVQVKFSIIEKAEQYGEIVSRISRYSNTQNKVNDADFSANNPALVVFEKLSRLILTPTTTQNNMQTYWFFERARGQYKTMRSREGTTKARQTAFDKKYPKNQVFSKVELAKYINAYQDVFEGKKLVIAPHLVVRGNEKNYAQFIANNLPDNENKINNVYFEDAIAKCLLYKTAEKRYGVGSQPFKIGEMRQVVAPYTISLINKITNNKLDLYKIWKNQVVSSELSDFIYDLMKQVNQFILDTYAGQHYIEKAKKEECWELVKNNGWNFNLKDIKADLIDEKNPPKRNTEFDISEQELAQNKEIIKSIPVGLWNEILQWGKDSELLDITKQTVVSNIAFKLRQNKAMADEEYQKGVEILDIVAKHNEELLQKAEEFAGKWVALKKPKHTDEEKDKLILGLMQKMISFNLEKEILSHEETDLLHDILNGKQENDFDNQIIVAKILGKLQKKGFKN
jgi:hypothetical protein